MLEGGDDVGDCAVVGEVKMRRRRRAKKSARGGEDGGVVIMAFGGIFVGG